MVNKPFCHMDRDLRMVSECIQVLESVHESSLKLVNFSVLNSSHSNALLNSTDRARLEGAVHKLSQLNSDQLLKIWLATVEKPISVEILWILNKNYVLQISSYLYLFPKFHDHFVENLVQLATATNNEKHAHQILSSILLQLICGNYLPSSAPTGLFQAYQSVLNNFVKKIVEILYSGGVQVTYNYVEAVAHNSSFMKSERQHFYSSHLIELLSCNPKHFSLFDAISEQIVQFETQTLSATLKQFVLHIFEVFACAKIFEEILAVVNSNNLNLWNILNMISIACEHYGEKPCLEILEHQFSESIIGHNEHMVYVSLIFIRQIFLQDPVFFQKYAKWFKNLRLNNAQFGFLFQCLERIVPYEPPICLKIHINEFPNTSCRSTLSDYITLAKTRLMDLKESTEYIGIFHPADKNGQKADLRKIIAHFNHTGEIVKLLIEASVFRRQYFNNVFLPYLLGKESEDLEGKTSFIDRLNKQGLISPTLYHTWQRSQRDS